MAVTPDHINITIDEDALRAQIRGILRSEMAAIAGDFRGIAAQLDPEGEQAMIQGIRAQAVEEFKANKEGEE